MQLSDAPAREVPGVWLGDPSSGWRWWFDASFTAWMVWAALAVACFPVLWLVLPVVTLLAILAWRAGASARRSAPPMVWRRRNWTGTLVSSAVWLLSLALVPSPSFWLLPMPWWLALLAAPALSVTLTRRVMPWVGNNTPVGYWRRVLPRIAGAPRPRRAPRQMLVKSLSMEETPNLTDLERAALTIDPKEIDVAKARRRTPAIEFQRWLPDADDARKVPAWAAGQRGVWSVRVDEGKHLVIAWKDCDNNPQTCTVKPGLFIVRDENGNFATWTREAFFAAYEVIDQ